MLSFGAGDQDSWSYGEGKSEEFCVASDVLDGFASAATGDELGERLYKRCFERSGNRLILVGQEPCPILSKKE